MMKRFHVILAVLCGAIFVSPVARQRRPRSQQLQPEHNLSQIVKGFQRGIDHHVNIFLQYNF
jgi:hypothetical protein